jgi:hypothetical protein
MVWPSFSASGPYLGDCSDCGANREMSGSLQPKLLIATMLLLVGMASAQSWAQYCREIDRSSGFCTVPDSALTPGEMDPALACVSSTNRPRSVTNAGRMRSSPQTDARRIRIGPPASSISGFRIGWEEVTDRETFGSNPTLASSGRSPKTRWKGCSGGRCA